MRLEALSANFGTSSRSSSFFKGVALGPTPHCNNGQLGAVAPRPVGPTGPWGQLKSSLVKSGESIGSDHRKMGVSVSSWGYPQSAFISMDFPVHKNHPAIYWATPPGHGNPHLTIWSRGRKPEGSNKSNSWYLSDLETSRH